MQLSNCVDEGIKPTPPPVRHLVRGRRSVVGQVDPVQCAPAGRQVICALGVVLLGGHHRAARLQEHEVAFGRLRCQTHFVAVHLRERAAAVRLRAAGRARGHPDVQVGLLEHLGGGGRLGARAAAAAAAAAAAHGGEVGLSAGRSALQFTHCNQDDDSHQEREGDCAQGHD